MKKETGFLNSKSRINLWESLIIISVTDISLSWSKADILVSLGIRRTFAVFQILGTCWETKETFKICVITIISIVIFLGYFRPRGKGAWGYPYVKHQPRRNNIKGQPQHRETSRPTGYSPRAFSFQNQKGRSSGPVAVLFTHANALKTDISWITRTLWSSGIISTRAGSTDERFILDPIRPVNVMLLLVNLSQIQLVLFNKLGNSRLQETGLLYHPFPQKLIPFRQEMF